MTLWHNVLIFTLGLSFKCVLVLILFLIAVSSVITSHGNRFIVDENQFIDGLYLHTPGVALKVIQVF